MQDESARNFNTSRGVATPSTRTSNSALSGFFSQDRPADFSDLRTRPPKPPPAPLPSPSKDSWVVLQEKQKEDARLVLLRQLKGLLNKLTIEKFDRIYHQIITAGIKEEEEVKSLMRMVFEKAVSQHHFIQMYVMLCGKLKSDFQQLLKDDHRSTKFRRILIDQCEDSFNANLEPIVVPPELSPDDAYEFELNYKKTMAGNMIFVGELLKSKMISQAILLECIDRLLQKRDECISSSNGQDQGVHHVEALCAFIHTVGPFFDNPQWRYYGDFCERMRTVEALAANSTLPFRVRCLMKDVLDARATKWKRQLPFQREGPTTLEELHAQQQSAGAQPPLLPNHNNRETFRDRHNAGDDGGWEVAAGKRGGNSALPKTPSSAASASLPAGAFGGSSQSAFSQMGRMRQERDRERRTHGGDSRRSAQGEPRRFVAETDLKKKTKKPEKPVSSSGTSGLLDVEGAREVARKEFSDLIEGGVQEGLAAFAGIKCANIEAQKALLIALLLQAAEKLVTEKDTHKKQRRCVFEFLVALASTEAFPPDTLKQGLREFMGVEDDEEGLYRDLMLDAPHLPKFMKEFFDVIEEKDPERRLLSIAALDDLRGKL